MSKCLSIYCIFLTQIAYATADQNCPAEWHNFNSSCFKYFPLNATVLVARQYCWESAGGADLASIHSAEENRFVQGLVNGVNLTGGNGFIIGLLFDAYRNALWADDSPVDFGSPVGVPPGTSPWHPIQTENATDRNWCTILSAADKSWIGSNCAQYQLGFVCRKSFSNDASPSPVYHPKNGFAIWLFPSFSVFSILAQFYVVWLIIKKSPPAMQKYRHFLCASTFSDISVTFIIGFLLVPDSWMPYKLGTTIYGLGRYFGNGTAPHIMLSMVIFAVFCQIGFQVISLFYRFASLMDREWPNFSRKTTNSASRAAMFLFALIYSLAITFLCKDVAYDLQTAIDQAQHQNGFILKIVSDALLAKLPFLYLDANKFPTVVSKVIGAMGLIQSVCILFTAFIIRHLRANVQHYTRHTYRLQLQLMVSLLVQLLLPCIFVCVPVFIVFILAMLHTESASDNSGQVCNLCPSKPITKMGVFFIEIYALLNSLTVVFFVTPYRRHFAKISGIRWLQRKFRKIFFGEGSNQINVSSQLTMQPMPQSTLMEMITLTPRPHPNINDGRFWQNGSI